MNIIYSKSMTEKIIHMTYNVEIIPGVYYKAIK